MHGFTRLLPGYRLIVVVIMPIVAAVCGRCFAVIADLGVGKIVVVVVDSYSAPGFGVSFVVNDFKIGATEESRIAYSRHAFADDNAFQRFAIEERAAIYSRNAVSDFNACQIIATEESRITDICNAVGDNNASKIVTVAESFRADLLQSRRETIVLSSLSLA